MEKRHRIFIAINLPSDIKKQLFLYSEKWLDLPAKWTPKDNLHITLEFLGALTDQEIGEICVVVKEVAERHESFSVNLNKVLYGPPNKMPPKMVWAEGEKSKELAELRQDLENSLGEKVAFVPENRAFAPHITLARISAMEFKYIEPEERPEINENIDLSFTVESIEVMESEMRKGGPIYTVLESHELGNG
ncbi:MAG: RNA 2',3'-cyclic phosphodiesterase [Candidatus Staskawiczbacteria bacterium]|jgi:2'-5' RNA ligase